MIRDACWWWQQSDSSFLGLGFFGGFLLASALVAGVGTDSSECAEHLAISVFVGNLGVFDGMSGSCDWQSLASYLVSSGGRFELLSCRVVDLTLLGFVLTSGEQNQLALIGVKSGDVQLELLLAGACSSVINGDSNASCESGGKTGVFELGKCEASAVAYFTSISASSLGDNRTQLFSWSGENTGSLGNSTLVSSELLGRLIEVGFGSSLPVLAKMDIDDHVVVLDHS